MFQNLSSAAVVIGALRINIAQKNRHIETVHLSTHNICFGWELRKSIVDLIPFSRPPLHHGRHIGIVHLQLLNCNCWCDVTKLTHYNQKPSINNPKHWSVPTALICQIKFCFLCTLNVSEKDEFGGSLHDRFLKFA